MKGTEKELHSILRRVMANGPLTTLPRQPRDLQLFLALGAAQLDPTRVYSEAQLNQSLKSWLAPFAAPYGVDHVTIRRCLVDAGLVGRDMAGSTYRVAAAGLAAALDDAAGRLDPAAIMAAVQAERKARKLAYDA